MAGVEDERRVTALEYGISGEELDRVMSVFDRFDTDKSGTISGEELGNIVTELGLSKTKEEVDAILKEADVSGDGSVDWAEFCKVRV
jgi:Ca2+-binding EF-hand superfamily protein